ncbi:hypothetical protein [Candidatus Methylacidithermus pantelleriae]|uniref:Uncharacterized protein n=1 Tax=Candidatus Methylacidithermus pantelleriae TaxID=2744239 RepID=A0A8J2BKX6_9BACT|nr:hypothetical protein [Candidatus Methylacidithermus pantelleriae]CAF0701131.1 hypothetical protein MPNT_40159 [Candidatus Methylacidithermus pantelleriae]
MGVGGRASRPLLAETYREERLPEEEAIHGWYLLEVHLWPPEVSPGAVLTHYERLAEV